MARRYYSSTAARTTLASGVDDSTTTFSVTAVSGWPASYPYTLVIDQDTVNEELVEVSARSGTTLTVTRGVDGTSAVAHDSGAAVNHGVSARDFDEPNAFINGTGTVTETLLASGAVTEAKLGTGAVTSAKILDGTIVNADINASAAIAQSKIADLTSDLASKVDYATPVNTQTGVSYTFVGDDAFRLTTSNSASAVTFTIPAASAVAWEDDTILRVVNYGAGAVTVAGGSGVTVTNTATTLAQYESAAAIRTGSDAWTLVPFGSKTPIIAPDDFEFLLIAGGGGGGNAQGGTYNGGGGGAGGYICSVQGENSGALSSAASKVYGIKDITYTVTIGAGGASHTSGSTSSLSAPGLSTVSCVGGGRGGGATATGASGGSGGGGRSPSSGGGAGTANQGSAGASGGSGGYRGGGGGGAGAAGSGGTGGSGISSAITASSVTRGGGGAGGPNGSAGSGGGGTAASAGGVNTGGGGGGGNSAIAGTSPGGSGGSGLFVLRHPDTVPTATVTGSPTISSSGGFTTYVFTASGTFKWES